MKHQSKVISMGISKLGVMLLAACSGWFMLVSNAHAQAVCKKKTNGYFKLVMANILPSALRVEGLAAPLTTALGDPVRGKALIAGSQKGNCLACHQIPPLSAEPHHGNLGPNLEHAGGRYTEAQLRQIIVEPRAVFPNTIMPAYFKKGGFQRAQSGYDGKAILTGQEVEDILAFLKTMK